MIDEIRLPVDIERGASGGPEFNTFIATTFGGNEKRNQNWDRARTRWDIGYGVQDQEGYSSIIAFFRARRGRARGFLFRDWSDYEVSGHVLGEGDGTKTDFQLVKTYVDAIASVNRSITRPVASTIEIAIDEVVQDSVDWSLQSKGIIRFMNAPAMGKTISWSGEFDIPVRFSSDTLDVDLIWYDAGSVPAIPVIEVFE